MKHLDKRVQKSGRAKSIDFDRLPENLAEIVVALSRDKSYDGHSRKSYSNKEGRIDGVGPFWEFVGQGNKQRLVFDAGTGEMYATFDHHKSYSLID